jgi:hypothetical protein
LAADGALHVSEPPAVYGDCGNTVRLPLLSRPPQDADTLGEANIEGFIELPRMLSKGAKYILAAPDRSGDYCMIRPETQLVAGKTMLLISKTGYKISICPTKHLPNGTCVAGQVVKVLKNLD